MADGTEILARRDKLKNNRRNYEDRWDKISKLFDSSSYGVANTIAEGQSLGDDVYDSTGQHALDMLGKFISSEIINPSQKFLNYTPGNPALKDDDAVKEWCEESRDRTLETIAKSNFFNEMPLSFKSLAGMGNASVFWGEKVQLPNQRPFPGFRGLRFRCDKIGRFLFGANANGEIDTNFIEFQLSARAAAQMFPKAAANSAFNVAINSKNEDKMCKFVHAVYPRPQGEKGYGSKGYAWASCYVEEESKKIVDESGFRYFPFFTPRWDLVPGEVYGRGAAELALHHAQTKNKARAMTFQEWALRIRRPVLAAQDSIIGVMRMKPAGVTVVNTRGLPVNQVVQPFDTGGDAQFNDTEDEKLRNEIRQMLYVDVISQVLEQDLKDVNNFTYAKKLDILFRLLGPVYGNVEHELRRLFDSLFLFLYEAGQFSQPPDILLEAGGEIQIEFDNGLARAASMADVNSINTAFADLAPFVNFEMQTKGYSEIMDGFDMDKLRDHVAKVRGIPATITKSPEEIKQVRDARAQQTQETQQKQDMMMMAEGAGKAAPALQMIMGGKQQAAAA